MEEIRCIKCGRPLHDPESIVRGMGPQCAGDTSGRCRKNRSGAGSRSGSSYMAFGYSSTAAPTLFSLVVENKQRGEEGMLEGAAPRNISPAQIPMQYPTDLIDLVLSAPAAGAIAKQIKNYSKQKKMGGLPPGRILQEIRRMCIDLRLTFFPGMSTPQGQQIACVPCGDDGWRFENSERVLSRQELEAYLSRYGIIRLASG